jgi:Fungalysin metallopeptidase (M36)
MVLPLENGSLARGWVVETWTAKANQVHTDDEIYAAAMWEVLEAYQGYGLSADNLMADFVDDMKFTPASPTPDKMRAGMLSSLNSRTDDGSFGTCRCAIWTGFALKGIGQGAGVTISRRGTATINQSFTVPTGVCPP